MNLSSKQYLLLLSALAALLYLPFLGAVHLFDWDEINFAESAREMIVSGNYARVTINFQPFWEKPPLFFWFQAVSMHLLGVNEFAARFPNAVNGILTVITLYAIGKKEFNEDFARIVSLAYLGTLLPFLYFKSGIIDPWFNYFIFTGYYFLYQAVTTKNSFKNAILAGLLLGLAVLTKGPVGLLLPGVAALVMVLVQFRLSLKLVGIAALILAVAFTVSSLWVLPEVFQNGPTFIVEFFEYQIRLFSTPDAGHKQPFYYHFVVVLVGCFPLSFFAIQAIRRVKSIPQFLQWKLSLLATVLIIFSVVQTKIVHYSSLAYLPVALLGAYAIQQQKEKLSKALKWPFFVLLGVVSLVLAALPLIGLNIRNIEPYFSNPEIEQVLSAQVNWSLLDFMPFVLFLGGTAYWLARYLKQNEVRYLQAWFVHAAASYLLVLVLLVPKVEQYSQGGFIQFLEGHHSEQVPFFTYKFRSYANFFYGKTLPQNKDLSIHAALENTLQQKAYIIAKWTRKAEVEQNYTHLQLKHCAGGFCFYEYQPNASTNGTH